MKNFFFSNKNLNLKIHLKWICLGYGHICFSYEHLKVGFEYA